MAASQTEREFKILFERAINGDQAAYRKFLHEMGDLLRRYVKRQLYRLKRSDSDAEDIVQEVLLAIHAKRHAYDSDVPITAWAHAIARYRMIDFLRATGHAVRNLSLEEVGDIAEPASTPSDVTLSLKKMLSALPERMRRPVELMKMQGFSAREAAAITNSSEAAVKVNAHRGLKALARAWGGR